MGRPSAKEAEIQRSAILEEAARGQVPWAGVYIAGTGGAKNWTLTISPGAGYVLEVGGDLGWIAASRGSVSVRGSLLVLEEWESWVAWDDFELPEMFHVRPWGKCWRLLTPEQESRLSGSLDDDWLHFRTLVGPVPLSGPSN